MLRVGLTGGIGSGKSAVSDMFQKLGVPVIDTDVIAHTLVDHDSGLLQKLSAAFGSSIIDPQGSLDRKQLAGLVFNDPARKQQLEAIMHPEIRRQVNKQLLDLNKDDTTDNARNYCIIVIPLLFETGFRELVDTVLVVSSDTDNRIERVQQRDKRSMDEIQAIISNQVSDDVRLQGADDIIQNNTDIKCLEKEVLRLHKKYDRTDNTG